MAQDGGDIPELVRQLQERLAAIARENDALKGDVDRLRRNKTEAEEEAAEAREQVEKIGDDLRKLRALSQGEYETVVAQLFKEPSQQAAKQTAIATVISIGIGLIATVFSVQYSLHRSDVATAGLRAEIFELVSQRTAESTAKTAAQLQHTEAKMTQSVQAAFQTLVPKSPSASEIIDLPRNVVVQRTIRGGGDLYFRLSLPTGV